MDGKHFNQLENLSQMLRNMFYHSMIMLFYLADQISVMHNVHKWPPGDGFI